MFGCFVCEGDGGVKKLLNVGGYESAVADGFHTAMRNERAIRKVEKTWSVMACGNKKDGGGVEEASVVVYPCVMNAGRVCENIPVDADDGARCKTGEGPVVFVNLIKFAGSGARSADTAGIVANQVTAACPCGHVECDGMASGLELQGQAEKVRMGIWSNGIAKHGRSAKIILRDLDNPKTLVHNTPPDFFGSQTIVGSKKDLTNGILFCRIKFLRCSNSDAL